MILHNFSFIKMFTITILTASLNFFKLVLKMFQYLFDLITIISSNV